MEMIIPALLFLTFAALFLGGLLYAFLYGRERQRLRGLIVASVSPLLLFPFIPMLPKFYASPSNMKGEYRGNLGGYPNHLLLREDCTFDQDVTLNDGKVNHSHGKWSMSTREAGSIDFENLLLSSDPQNQGKLVASGFDGADVRMVDDSIVFNDDTGEHLDRVK